MKFKALSLVAVVLLVAACSNKPKEEAATTTNTTAAAPPPSAPATSIQQQLQQVGDRVYFAFDKSDITSEAQATLSKQADLLKANPQVRVTIEGNCDERGTREYNLALGERRANAAKQALIALGVSGDRVNTISYGKERPINPGHNDAAWAENRNGHTVVQ